MQQLCQRCQVVQMRRRPHALLPGLTKGQHVHRVATLACRMFQGLDLTTRLWKPPHWGSPISSTQRRQALVVRSATLLLYVNAS